MNKPALNIPGLETLQGMVAVKGDINQYLLLLQMFANAHNDDMKQVQKSLVDGDRQQAQRLTHGLNGVAGVLGARRVSELASKLENALRANAIPDECLALARQCDDELTQLVLAIHALPELELSEAAPNHINNEQTG